jgi:hypothetical protein
MRRAYLVAGWVKGEDGIWTMTRRREQLMEGRAPKFRRYAGSGPGNVERHFILNPIQMKCWSCGLVQTVDPPENPPALYS